MLKIAFDTGSLCKVLCGDLTMDGIARYTYEITKALLDKNQIEPQFDIKLLSILYPQFSSTLRRHYEELGYSDTVLTTSGSFDRVFESLVEHRIPLSRGKLFGSLTASNARPDPETKLIHWPLAIRDIPGKPKGILNCVTVHDLIPITAPQLCSEATIQGLSPVLHRAAAESDHFFAVSEYTKGQLCDYFNISPDRVSVVPLAADRRTFYPVEEWEVIQEMRDHYSIPDGDYILSLAAMDPRKNLKRIIDSFSSVLHETKREDLYLVLAGKERPGITAELDRINSSSDINNYIVFTGYIEEKDLAALYSGAILFANPSLIEGFGLPPLEAMQCGTPVVTSRTTSIPEVTGSAAILVNPESTAEITDAIMSLLEDSSLRAQYSSSGLNRAAKFSWQRSARKTAKIYGELL